VKELTGGSGVDVILDLVGAAHLAGNIATRGRILFCARESSAP
jgi:NADPH:quinone reductase-like Zn-dependent oxidoreductase